MLRNYKDIRTIVFVLILAGIRTVLWWQDVSLLWLPLAVLTVFLLYTVKHNHLHAPVFHSSIFNRALAHVLDVFTGNTFHGAYIVHMANHHRETNNHRDWGATHSYKHTKGLVNLVKYALTTPFIFIKEKRKWLKARKHRMIHKQIALETTLMCAVYSLMLIFRFRETMWLILLPNLLGQLVLVSFNYFQHEGCDPNSAFNHSRNFTGRFMNYLTFNNGFHTAHHHFPARHWSEYPAIHRRLQSCIDERLNEDNFSRYFFRLLSGRR